MICHLWWRINESLFISNEASIRLLYHFYITIANIVPYFQKILDDDMALIMMMTMMIITMTMTTTTMTTISDANNRDTEEDSSNRKNTYENTRNIQE